MQINWYETSLSSDYATIGGQGGRVTMGFLESPTKISNNLSDSLTDITSEEYQDFNLSELILELAFLLKLKR